MNCRDKMVKRTLNFKNIEEHGLLGYFGFDTTIYGNHESNNKKRKWCDELRDERRRDIDAESNSA